MTTMESVSVKKYMLFIAAASLAVTLVTSTIAGARAGRIETENKMRDVAHDVVREEWLHTLEEETKRIAAEAARDAADRAIRETVTPVAVEIAAHRAMDDQRNADQNRRLDRLEEQRAGKR